MFKIIIFFFFVTVIWSQPNPLTVRKLSTGYIRGRTLVTENGNEGYLFIGVPYAKPPLSYLRFRKPEKQQRPWLGVLNTTEYKASCYWNSTETSNFANQTHMSEDCLHVNVYTSKHCLERGGCPIIHYSHGGKFIFGTPIQFNHSFLVDNFASRDVIFVSVGFRQAVFGVLNFNHKLNLTTDTNVGFHDIMESLRWIQNEITVLGGNPNKVTCMGHSGGALIVNLLLVSPASKNFCNQAVMMSGAMGFNSFPLLPDRNEHTTRYIAINIGCASEKNTEFWDNTTNVNNVIECLRSKSAHELSSQQMIAEKAGLDDLGGVALDFGPNALFPAPYEELLENVAEMPLLTGTVSKETLASKFLIKEAVYVDQPLLYWYCEQIFITRGFNYTNETVATYILGQHLGNFTKKDKKIQKIFSGFFADFAKHGDPSPGWNKFETKEKNYFLIDFDEQLTMPGMKKDYHDRAIKFWDLTIGNMTGGTLTIESESDVAAEIKLPSEPVPFPSNSSPPVAITENEVPQGTNWKLLFWLGVGVIVILVVLYIITLCVYGKQRRKHYETMM